MKPYILDDASTLEYQRLDLMSKILDPWTRGYLTALGVSQGWQCLELGGGNGSIAEWLCATVGPSGSVTSIDINPVLLELDWKSTRLNSSHANISYAVFCLKKKNI